MVTLPFEALEHKVLSLAQRAADLARDYIAAVEQTSADADQIGSEFHAAAREVTTAVRPLIQSGRFDNVMRRLLPFQGPWSSQGFDPATMARARKLLVFTAIVCAGHEPDERLALRGLRDATEDIELDFNVSGSD